LTSEELQPGADRDRSDPGRDLSVPPLSCLRSPLAADGATTQEDERSHEADPGEDSERGEGSAVTETSISCRTALANLVAKIDAIHNDEQFKAVWVFYVIHGFSYQGPKYVDELSEARAVLARTRAIENTTDECDLSQVTAEQMSRAFEDGKHQAEYVQLGAHVDKPFEVEAYQSITGKEAGMKDVSSSGSITPIQGEPLLLTDEERAKLPKLEPAGEGEPLITGYLLDDEAFQALIDPKS
jgi:hypothetical protein